jgi:diguanylate cyclase (GGDEF)-like protein
MSSTGMAQPDPTDDFSERSLTAGYVLALGLIACLTIASHLTLNRVLAEHEGSAAIVNISGRQRMLSQRIASFAAQVRLGAPTARDDLLRAADRFEAAHHQLLIDSTQTAGSRSAEAFRSIYFGGEKPLDTEVADYLRLARRIAKEPPAAPAMDADLAALLAEARSPLLTRLDQVVQMHQQDSESQLTRLQWLQRITLLVVLITLATEALLIFRPMVRRIARYARELKRLATVDALTGTFNRHHFVERGEVEISRAQRTGNPPAVLMIDADHFKQINDRFGHAGGDAALRALGQALRDSLRPTDVLGRIGGEEFAIVLPQTSREGAIRLAERLRGAIAGLTIEFAGHTIPLTVSIGVATGKQSDLTALLRDADAALYQAKAAGRNRVDCVTA